jgi:hypothetical protein
MYVDREGKQKGGFQRKGFLPHAGLVSHSNTYVDIKYEFSLQTLVRAWTAGSLFGFPPYQFPVHSYELYTI